MELNEVLPRLSGVRIISNGYLAFCPAHQDVSNRSLSLTERDGKLLIHCFSGCSFGNILKSLGIEKDYKKPELEAIYDYTDEDGNLLYQVVRYYPKSFKQRYPDGNDYIWNLKGIKKVLFQLPKVLNANDETIFFVEGEKDCINLGMYDIIATTCSGGAAQEWQPQYSEALKDTRVAIIPDNDKPGKKHAEKVANSLYGWAKSLKILELGSQDVTEWLKTHNIDELRTLINITNEYIPIGAVTRDEFNELKGHLIYIHDLFNYRKSKKVRTNRYNVYK